MPVILPQAQYASWLAGGERLLHPCPDNVIDIRRVHRAVNYARNEGPRLIEPDAG
jgi:putative SOS response-associated peptidase YedK